MREPSTPHPTGRTVRVGAFIASLGLALVATLPAAAAPNAQLPVTGRPIAPAVAFAANTYTNLLVWAEDTGAGTGLDLYGLRLSATGLPTGRITPILIAPGNQSDPTLIFSPRINEFFLAFTDDSGQLGGAPPSSGTPGFPIPGQTPGAPTPPGLPTPNVPLALDAGPNGSAPADAEQRIARQFELAPLQGPAPTFPPPGTPAPGGPGGTPIPPTTLGSRDIYGTFLSTYGTRTSNIFPLVTSPADDTYPDITIRLTQSSDRYVLVWRKVTGLDVTLASVELEGVGRNFYVKYERAVVSGTDIGRPSVAAEPNAGEYMVLWAETPKDQPQREVYGRLLNNNAVPYKGVIKVATGAADQVYPTIASLGGYGGYLAAWEERMGGDPPDVKIRRLNRNGIPYGYQSTVAGGPAFSFAPDLASTDSVLTLIVWLDRNAAGDHSILAAQLNRDGRRIGPDRVVVTGGSGPGALTPVAPGPGFPTPPAPPPPLATATP
ncbi:MAG: hypothetical protein ABI780_01685 [Ardenticatenales bacterium]